MTPECWGNRLYRKDPWVVRSWSNRDETPASLGLAEVRDTMRKLIGRKAAGISDIRAEMLKSVEALINGWYAI